MTASFGSDLCRKEDLIVEIGAACLRGHAEITMRLRHRIWLGPVTLTYERPTCTISSSAFFRGCNTAQSYHRVFMADSVSGILETHTGFLTISEWESCGFADIPREVSDTILWIREYVARPHSMIGKSGPVCPKVPGALNLNAIYLKIASAGEYSESAIIAEVRTMRSIFFKLEPLQYPNCVFKTLLLLLPQGDEANRRAFAEKLQQDLKPWFLEKGLLLGKFHKTLNTTALNNPMFRPSQSPHSMLAVRYVVPGDIRFILTSGAPPQSKLQVMEVFLAYFGDTLPKVDIKFLQDNIKRLKEVIH
jgi:hypothetical protein